MHVCDARIWNGHTSKLSTSEDDKKVLAQCVATGIFGGRVLLNQVVSRLFATVAMPRAKPSGSARTGLGDLVAVSLFMSLRLLSRVL